MSGYYRAAIFDLDGVIVDTAHCHYLAWKRVANELSFDFSENDNERLKGVSRDRSLEILLELGKVSLDRDEKCRWMTAKNDWYLEYISALTEKDILPGAVDCLRYLCSAGIQLGIGSASKNTPYIMQKIKLGSWFDAVVDGNSVQKAKPDPQCFSECAQRLNVAFPECVVFEDSEAGLQAAKELNMLGVGIGEAGKLPSADKVITSLEDFDQVKLLFS